MQKPTQGTIVNVATSLSCETLTPVAGEASVATPADYQTRVIRIATDADIHYRLDGTAATGADPDIPLAAGTERYEYIPEAGDVSVYGTGTVNVILMG